MAAGSARTTAGAAGCARASANTGFDLARQLPALFHHQLAVADLAVDLARAVDHQLLAHGEGAVEFAMDLGNVDLCRALECAVFRDMDHARIHGGFYRAFHYQRVAVGDLHALSLMLGPTVSLLPELSPTEEACGFCPVRPPTGAPTAGRSPRRACSNRWQGCGAGRFGFAFAKEGVLHGHQISLKGCILGFHACKSCHLPQSSNQTVRW